MTEESQFAIVRNGNVMFKGNEAYIAIYRLPGDMVWPYEPPKTNTAHVDYVDVKKERVRAINPVTARTKAEQLAWRNTTRAVSFPYLSDQIAAILKQLDLMTKDSERHPEFQAILDAVAEVKTRLA
jgi:hypothetical protein